MADTRVAGLIAGVANHEARRVYDARVAGLRRAVAETDTAHLKRQLCDAIRLELWRARSITGFDAFAQDVVGLDAKQARELAEQGAAEALLPLERLPDVAIALTLRAEVALLERFPGTAISIRVEGEQLHVTLQSPLAPAVRIADALAALGRSAEGLARILSSKPRPK